LNEARINAARQILVEQVTLHRQLCENPSCEETANLLAWVGHSIGFKAVDNLVFLDRLAIYDRHCIQKTCVHDVEPRGQRLPATEEIDHG